MAKRRLEEEEDDPLYLSPMGLYYRSHRCAVVNIFLGEVLGLQSPVSERLGICRRQKILQIGDDLGQQRLKAYLEGSVVWLARPDLPGEAYFAVRACEVVYFDEAPYLLPSSDSTVTDFPSPWTFFLEASDFPRSGYDARFKLMAGNARRDFGCVFMSMNYQFMHQAGTGPLRVAPYASLHQCANLETLSEVLQVIGDFKGSWFAGDCATTRLLLRLKS